MKTLGTLLPALLFAVEASARGLKIRRRPAEGDIHEFLSGLELPGQSENPPALKLFLRDAGCPSYAPNACDVFWCAQNCCGFGNGNYCLYDEYCLPNGCCDIGKTCTGKAGTTTITGPNTPSPTPPTTTTTTIALPPPTTTRPPPPPTTPPPPPTTTPPPPPTTTPPPPPSTTLEPETSTLPEPGTSALPEPETSTLPEPETLTQSLAATPTRTREELQELVIDALEDVPDIDLFAGLVKDQPELFELLNPESNYTIFAPNNAAVGKASGGGVSSQLELSFVEQGVADPPLVDGPRTLKTALQNPNYVNLGPGESAKVVSLPDGTNINIVSGMGKSVIFEALDNPFGGGAIHVGEDFFTLPEDLSTTLQGTNGTQFDTFLSFSGRIDSLSSFEGITIFALTDTTPTSVTSRLTNATLDQHIIEGFSGYTPDLVDGKSYVTAAIGGSITISIQGGNYFANGVKIVKSDAITKNGVVHYVEDIIPYAPNIAVSIAGGPSISPFVTLLAVVAALIPYYLIA